MGAEREAQKGRDMYIIIADLHCCMAETKAISHQLKKCLKINKMIFIHGFN